MIFRLSQKINAKIDAGKLTDVPADPNPYIDWSAHLFVANRSQYILLTNTPSLYSTLIFGVGISNDSLFIERALNGIREFMEADGQGFVYKRFLAPSSETVTFAKALARSVTGSMNDLIYHAKHWLSDDRLSPFDVAKELNGIPFKPLKLENGRSYGNPREAFKLLAKKTAT